MTFWGRAAALALMLLPVVASAQQTGPALNVTPAAIVAAGGCVIGDDCSGADVTATGGATARTLAARAADVLNAKDGTGTTPGALGDAESQPSCTISASSDSLYCPAANFTTTPYPLAGEAYYLQGTGTAGIPQTGTITSVTDAHHLVLSNNAVQASPTWGIYTPARRELAVTTPGSGYKPGDTYSPAGTGTPAVLTIAYTQVNSVASVVSGGSGGVNTTSCVVKGTTGTGTVFTATGTTSGGVLQSGVVLTTGGVYSAAITNDANEPVTPVSGCTGLIGAALSLNDGGVVAPLTGTSSGFYTAAVGNPLTQGSTSGSGTGATFTANGAASTQISGRFISCADDTAAITAEAAAAAGPTGTPGRKWVFPPGGYCLFSQTTPIPLYNLVLQGGGKKGYYWPFFNSGTSAFLIFNQATNAFNVTGGVEARDLTFYYPQQDNTESAPIAFPATFEVTVDGNFLADDLSVVNAYDCFLAPASNGNFSRFTISNSQLTCVHYGFDMLNGNLDNMIWGPTNRYDAGSSDGLVATGSAVMDQAMYTTGEFMHIDLSNAVNVTAEGIQLEEPIWNGIRYGVRMVGTQGSIYSSNFSEINADGVQTILSVEGSTYLRGLVMSVAHSYSENPYNQAEANPVINLAGSGGQSILYIKSLKVQQANGDVIDDAGSISRLIVDSAQIYNPGLSTAISTYYGFHETNLNTGYLQLSNWQMDCNHQAGGSGVYGVLIAGAGTTGVNTLSNMQFHSCTKGWFVSGTLGKTNISDIGEYLSITASQDTTSSAALLTLGGSNFWTASLPPVLRSMGTPTSCGTGTPTVSGSWMTGIVTPASGATACTVPFPTTLTTAPTCSVWPEASTTAGLYLNGAPTTASFIVGMTTAGAFGYRCTF